MIRLNLKTILIQVSLFCIITICCKTIHNRPSDWAKKITSSKFSDLYVLNDSIYRSEQPGNIGFTLIDSLGIKSVLSLREFHQDSVLINGLKLNLYNVKINPYYFGDREIVKALRILEYSPKPIIIHCNIGGDRTGVVIAMYRIIYQNWTKEKAINEMKNGDYGFHWIFFNMPNYINNVNINMIRKEIYNQN
jgi:protein tyrosine/serine phosphatase